MANGKTDFSDPGLILSILGAVISLLSLFVTIKVSPLSKTARNVTLLFLAISLLSTGFFLTRPTVALPPTDPKDQDHFELGLQHYHASRYPKAIEEFEKFIQAQQQNDEANRIREKISQAYYYLGSSYLKLSRPDCEGAFRQITQIQHHNSSDSLLDKLFYECREAHCSQCIDTEIR